MGGDFMPEIDLDHSDVKKLWQKLLEATQNQTATAKKIGVTYATMRRWILGEHIPREEIIRKMAQLDIAGLEDALRDEFPRAFNVSTKVPDEVLEISSAYFSMMLGIRASVGSRLLQYTVHNHVYDDIVSQIDPRNKGLMLLFVECVCPEDPQEKISHLRVTSGRGTSSLWSSNQIEHSFDIGKDSLCGTAITTGSPSRFPQIDASEIATPLLHPDDIQSAAAFPITFCGDYVAGVLFVASIDVDFFTLAKRNLLRSYATMMGLGLKDDQFYHYDRICLV
jgi:transcriptional regulator with XRE-family HTH domain